MMKRLLFFLFGLLITILIIPLLLYFFVSNGNISTNVNDWICFSSILSASVGTAISAITLLIVLLDRKTSDNEKKTNQFIDYLFRQNEAVTKGFVANGYVEVPIEYKFGEINNNISEEYCNTVLFDYIKMNKLSSCPNEVQDYLKFGFSVARKTTNLITTEDFDETISDSWKKAAIKNAFTRSITFKDDGGYTEQGIFNPSPIKTNFEVIELLNIPNNYDILQIFFNFSNIRANYPYSISSFINTYRYALLHLLTYEEGISIYFSQLSLEQKIFIAYDIISWNNKTIYNVLKKSKNLYELLTEEALNRAPLLRRLYKI